MAWVIRKTEFLQKLGGVSHTWGYPKLAGCFMENPMKKWMMTGGIPILGNLHIPRMIRITRGACWMMGFHGSSNITWTEFNDVFPFWKEWYPIYKLLAPRRLPERTIIPNSAEEFQLPLLVFLQVETTFRNLFENDVYPWNTAYLARPMMIHRAFGVPYFWMINPWLWITCYFSKITSLRIMSWIECYHSTSAQHMTYLDAEDLCIHDARLLYLK